MKRSASHAGTWYSKDSKTLSDMLDKWLYEAAMDGTGPKSKGPIRAVIAPHAGLSYSGKTAAFAYAGVDPDAVSRVFVLGPSHHVYLDGCALSRCSVYETPLGDMNVDAASVALLKATGLFGDMDLAVDEEEHSIEMHLPFIHKVMARKTNGPFQIVPILVGSLSPAKQALYGRILAPYLAASDSLFVVSSDFCHWGSRFRYTPHDPQTPIFKHIEDLDRTGMDLIENLDVGARAKVMGDSGSDPFASTFSISSTGAGGNASRAPNWVFTAEQLAESVSVAEGSSHMAEAAARLSACGFMEKVAMRMRNIPPETLPVAKVYLLRFCQRQIVARTNGAVHPYVAGATALFLACKSTDNYRKLPTFIKQCRWVAFKGPEGVKDEFVERPQFKDDDKEYVNWYENIITTEENMTVALCFDLVVDLPHEIVVELLKLCWNGSALESSVDYASFSQQIYQKLKHHASFFANECMSTTLPLRFNRNLQALIILRVAWEATRKGFPISSTPPKVLEFLNSGNPLVAPGNPGLNLFHAPDLFRIIGNFRGANVSYDGIYSGIAALEEEPLKGEALSNRLFGTAISFVHPEVHCFHVRHQQSIKNNIISELGKEILLVSNRPKYEKFIQNWLRPISGALKEKRAVRSLSVGIHETKLTSVSVI
ncbi:hypothetical protein HDU80_007335 [Chytriomyces hyalinus]|nr:hypothetical protein HDU80_007335 [Chytriomyces hyalinus]